MIQRFMCYGAGSISMEPVKPDAFPGHAYIKETDHLAAVEQAKQFGWYLCYRFGGIAKDEPRRLVTYDEAVKAEAKSKAAQSGKE